jgi:hypothetical protein
MDDVIDICSGCGKMPRVVDLLGGAYVCSRCGNRSIISVKTDDYEKVAQELDQKFHMATQKQRIAAAANHPVDMKKPAKKSSKTKSAKAKPAKAKPAKKPAAKKTTAKKRR